MKHPSAYNKPLSCYHQRQTILRILGVNVIKRVPLTPSSHPYIERLNVNQVVARYVVCTLFVSYLWNDNDLERKLQAFAQYYNPHGIHQFLPENTSAGTEVTSTFSAMLDCYSWRTHYNRLNQAQVAA